MAEPKVVAASSKLLLMLHHVLVGRDLFQPTAPKWRYSLQVARAFV